MEKKQKILIVGAGLAGLAMYIALDKKKFDVEIVEKRDQFKRLGYALIFMPLGVRALKNLGFTNTQIHKIGKYTQENRLRDKNGKLKLVTNFRPLIQKFDKYMMATRQRLYKLLETRVPKNKVRFGATVQSITLSRNREIHVGFNRNENRDYDLVIGADGINSAVRKFIFPHAKPQPLGLSLIWAWIPKKEGIYPSQPGAVGDEKAGVGFFNSGEKGKSCMAFFIRSKDVPRGITPKEYKKLLRTHLNGFGATVPKILKHLPEGQEMYLHDDFELSLEKWHEGKIVLIGDAAHARSVFSGAGSALALEDALVLGDYLNKEKSSEVAIRKYYKTQKKRVEQLTMSKLRLYLQDQRGVVKYLSDFFASSLLYKNLKN